MVFKIISKELDNIKDKDIANAVAKSVEGRGIDAQREIIHSFTDREITHNGNISYLQKETIIQAAKLVDSISSDRVAKAVADRINMRAPYFNGDKEAEVISDLGKTICMYKDEPAIGIIRSWDHAVYNSDYGEVDGGLAVSKIMQEPEIVKEVNGLHRSLPAKEIAEFLADMANYLRDADSVAIAAKAIAKVESGAAAYSFAKDLADKAERLRVGDGMGLSWNPVGPNGKVTFLKEVCKGPTEIKELIR